jgi:hypothetical protein
MAKSKIVQIDKGGEAEEALRHYFRNLGAFVLRGVPLRQGREDITDIDLWTYTRASVHARHIAIIDIKNKRRSKGYERIIWLRGLRSALRADEAIVATNSGRENLKPFADRMGVRLLSHQVFQAVMSHYIGEGSRLSSEELDHIWRNTKLDTPMNLYGRMRSNLEEVSFGINFSSLNKWIDEAASLMVYALDHERTPGPIYRAVLLCCGLIALGGDYLGKDIVFADLDARKTHFKNGLVFGKSDSSFANSFVNFAEKLVTDFVDSTGASAAAIRHGFARAADDLPVNQFIEFFARPTAGRDLMDAALQLEDAAFARSLPNISSLPTEAKTICLLVADYAGIERRRLVGIVSATRVQNTDAKSEKDLLLSLTKDGKLL